MTNRRRLVRVPASSANLGPGYDVMAAAVSLHLELEVEEAGEFSFDPGGADVPTGRENLIVRAFESLRPADGIAFRLRSEIPLARGLGSSAAAIVAGLLAADHLFELGLSKEEMLVEGERASRATPTTSPPRSTAASSSAGPRRAARCAARFDPPKELEAVVAIPAEEVSTERAREAIPARGAARRRGRQRRRRLAARARVADAPTSTSSPAGSPTASTSRAAATSTRARWSSSTPPPSWARSGRRSPAPGRPCSSGPPGRTPARSPRSSSERSGWAEVRRLPFSPHGADVPEL